MTKVTLIKESIYRGIAYSFRALVHHHHGKEHDSMHGTGTVAESHILVLERGTLGLGQPFETSKPNASDTLLQQGHTF